MPLATRLYGLLYRLTLGIFAVLFVTGGLLWFWFRPVDVPIELIDRLPRDVQFSYRLDQLHRVAAVAFGVSATATGVMAIVRTGRAQSLRVLLSVSLVIAMLGGLASSQELRWQQLGLRSGGRDVKGYHWLFSDDILFISVGDRVVSSGFLAGWLFLHVVVVSTATIVCLTGLRPGRAAVFGTATVDQTTTVPMTWDLGHVPVAPPILDDAVLDQNAVLDQTSKE